MAREEFPEDEGGWRTSNKKLLFQVFTGHKPFLPKNIYIIYICNIPVYSYSSLRVEFNWLKGSGMGSPIEGPHFAFSSAMGKYESFT